MLPDQLTNLEALLSLHHATKERIAVAPELCFLVTLQRIASVP